MNASPKSLTSTAQPRADGGYRQAHDAGNLLHRHSFEFEHDEGPTKVVIELGEQAVGELAGLFLVESLFRIGRERGSPVGIIDGGLAPGLVQHVPGRAKGGREQKGALAARSNGVGTPKRDEEHVLNDLVRERRGDAETTNELPNVRVMNRDELANLNASRFVSQGPLVLGFTPGRRDHALNEASRSNNHR
jgi:hypothetical protein